MTEPLFTDPRIEYLPHGILVRGPIAVGTFADLCARFEGIGCTINDSAIKDHYGALLAFPFPGHRGLWRAELGLPPVILEPPALVFCKTTGRVLTTQEASR